MLQIAVEGRAQSRRVGAFSAPFGMIAFDRCDMGERRRKDLPHVLERPTAEHSRHRRLRLESGSFEFLKLFGTDGEFWN